MNMRTTIITILLLLAPGLKVCKAWGAANDSIKNSLKQEFVQNLVRQNPALIHCASIHPDFFNQHVTNQVDMSFLNTATKGDYLYYDGKRKNEYSVHASGEHLYTKIGTVYGEAGYTRGKKKGIAFNYAVNPEVYYPYLVGDSLGRGNYDFERYDIMGGYGFRLGNTFVGLEGTYTGTVAAKKMSPKISAFDSWIHLNFGVAQKVRNTVYALRVYPEFNKQSIKAGDYKKLPVKYFQYYGFGNWNQKESTAGYSMGKQLSVLGTGTELAIHSLSGNKKKAGSLVAGYRFLKMKSEETSFKNLFERRAHQFYLTGVYNWKHRFTEYEWIVESRNKQVNGTENIYENREVSQENNLYDYYKVGENNLYGSFMSFNRTALKFIFNLASGGYFSLVPELALDYRKETYDVPSQKISHLALLPKLGVGYGQKWKRNDLSCGIHAQYRASLSDDFVVFKSDKNNQFDTLVRIPYEVFGESHIVLGAQISYLYQLRNRHYIGGSVQWDYLNRTDIPEGYPYASAYSSRSNQTGRIAVCYQF